MSVQAGRKLVITLAPERDGRVVAVLDDVTREQEALEALLQRHRLADGKPFAVPYRTDLWIARRSGA